MRDQGWIRELKSQSWFLERKWGVRSEVEDRFKCQETWCLVISDHSSDKRNKSERPVLTDNFVRETHELVSELNENEKQRLCLSFNWQEKFGWQVSHSLNSFLSLNFTEFWCLDHDSLLSILSFTWSCLKTLFLNFLHNSSECISQGTDTEISYFFVTVANDCLFIMTFEWIHPNPLSSRQSKQDMKGWDFLFLLPLILSLFLLRSLQTWK